jgi:dipeptidyl aminopeptidase/acylaminoacyl peptidase
VQARTSAALRETPPPEVFRWKTFDARMLTGLRHNPPVEFKGKRPVLIDIHGGPEEQARPYFLPEDVVYSNDLGVVRLYPNVRGSSGFGKTFLALDDGLKRADVLKDIGALLDWIKMQPDLDAGRVAVSGFSYGGYLSLLAAANYGTRLRGAISYSGISNLVTYLENTDGWRREMRRAEYGDERVPAVRAALEKAAPRTNAARIVKPLLIAQGANDPRVPAGEAEAMAGAARKNGVPVWLIIARNEGHQFSAPENQRFLGGATLLFLQQFLLQ